MPKKLLLILAAALFAAQALAKGNISSEWGLTAGIRFNGRTSFNAPAGLSLTPALSYNIGLQAGIGNTEVAFQPELNYGYTATKIRLNGEKAPAAAVKAHDIEIPLLVSLRMLPVVRFNAGPVFNVMSTASYDNAEGERAMLGGLQPTFGYAAGAAAVPTEKLLIEIRFTGYLQRAVNQYEGCDFKTKPYSVGIKIGYLF